MEKLNPEEQILHALLAQQLHFTASDRATAMKDSAFMGVKSTL